MVDRVGYLPEGKRSTTRQSPMYNHAPTSLASTLISFARGKSSARNIRLDRKELQLPTLLLAYHGVVWKGANPRPRKTHDGGCNRVQHDWWYSPHVLDFSCNR